MYGGDGWRDRDAVWDCFYEERFAGVLSGDCFCRLLLLYVPVVKYLAFRFGGVYEGEERDLVRVGVVALSGLIRGWESWDLRRFEAVAFGVVRDAMFQFISTVRDV